MMAQNAATRKLWMKTILEQYAALHPRDRQRARWCASTVTLGLLGRVLDGDPLLLSVGSLLRDDAEVRIAGLPVDVDDAVEGVVLVVR